jgi:hypothetical protein
MSKLNFKQPYGVVYGHDIIRYTQEGKNFGPRGEEILPTPVVEKLKAQKTDATTASKPTALENAKAFLLQILKENPLSKSAIYKEAENNNYNWNDVRDAAIALDVGKFTQKNLEMWKLPEGASA